LGIGTKQPTLERHACLFYPLWRRGGEEKEKERRETKQSKTKQRNNETNYSDNINVRRQAYGKLIHYGIFLA
jgi:hypothetical protein